ncbi:MAG: hypothetical protein QOF21_1622 [Actinomycetota bacterium]
MLRRGLAVAAVALAASAFGVPASAAESTQLVGAFALTSGACPSGTGTGSYFRMVQPSGNAATGPFVANGDSTCSDQTFTLLSAGTDGGFVTGSYQPAPNPAFDGSGNSQANRISAPATFFGVKFGLSTDPKDLQTGTNVPALTVNADDAGHLTGDLRAWAATWNKQYFNQGAPKPDGSKPGLTTAAHGTYNASTGAFVLEWASTVEGGPFNDFTGTWHMEGTFRSAATTSAPAASSNASAKGASAPRVGSTATTSLTAVAGEQVDNTATTQPSSSGSQVAIAAVEQKGWRPPAWLILFTALIGVLAAVAVLLGASSSELVPPEGGKRPGARPDRGGTGTKKKGKGPQITALAIGVGLVLAPVAFQMFTRAPKGGDMIESFKPYMRTAKIDSFTHFIDDIGVANTESTTALASLPASTTANYTGVTALNRDWPGIDTDMRDMLTTMRADIPRFNGIAALPPFVLFPWFFVLPGLMIAGVAGWSLVKDRDGQPARGRVIALAALGIGLIAAPGIFQMFTRAPGGAEMINDFKPLMAPAKVTRIQGYFLTIGLAEGDLRNKVVPAEAAAGRSMPAATALSAEWPKQSGDMAPMIAAMADNQDNFNAVVALPPFWLFPWFFVFPGLLVLIAALLRTDMIGFPNPVNEISARLVATGVFFMAVATIVFDAKWIVPILFYGFVARVLTGPKLSPLGQLVTRQITPRLPFKEKLVPGPPKRFAQGMGVAFSGAALVLGLVFDQWLAAQVVLGLLIVAASLEAFVGLCLGCKVFAWLMRLGVIPEEVCEACNNVGARLRTAEVAAK